jgi:hypothetical protein
VLLQDHDVYKRRLDSRGLVIENTVEQHKVGPETDEKLKHEKGADYCGSCYGAHSNETHCCQTCDEVRWHPARTEG